MKIIRFTANKYSKYLTLGLLFFFEPAFCFPPYLFRASFDIYPYYYFSNAPFTVIKTDTFSQINNRIQDKQFHNPYGLSLSFEQSFLPKAYYVIGYSYTDSGAKSDISTNNGITRNLKLENLYTNELYTGLKYYIPSSEKPFLTYLGFDIGIAIYPQVNTAVDTLNNINTEFGQGKLSAPYYKKNVGGMAGFNVGIARALQNKLYALIDIGIKVSTPLKGAGLVFPVQTRVSPEVLAVKIGNTGHVISVPLRIGILF